MNGLGRMGLRAAFVVALTVATAFFSCRDFSKPYDEYCTAFGGCDGGIVPECPPGKKLGGEVCQAPADCCSNVCNIPFGSPAGLCTTPVAACGAQNQPCGNPANCCQGLTCNNGTCVQPGQADDAGAVNGTTCTSAAQCLSGFCSDGVCCNTRCGGPCDYCSNTGSVGVCQVAARYDPGTPTCAPYRCNGNSSTCAQSCSPDSGTSECLGFFCNLGSCGPIPNKPLGAFCSGTTECLSGFCSDGVCCNEACTGVCGACNIPGSEGVCNPRPKGTRPEPAPCNFLCDGVTLSCPPQCAKDYDCLDPSKYCNGGTCVSRLSQGSPCTRATQCGLEFCSEGYCCNQACDLPCDTCNAGGNFGNCQPRQSGQGGIPACFGGMTCSGGASCLSPCLGDNDCGQSGYCGTDDQCHARKDVGTNCSADNECQKGFCAGGTCCDSRCGQACETCGTGQCVVADAGTSGNPFCGVGVCNGEHKGCPCGSTVDCFNGETCLNGHCTR